MKKNEPRQQKDDKARRARARRERDDEKRSGFGNVLRFCFWALLIWVVGGTIWLYVKADDSLEFSPSQLVVTEVTQLHKIQVARVVVPKTTEELSTILKETRGTISIGGARCSMGGQVAEPGSTHLDMRQLNRVLALDVPTARIRVQAGITWRDVQDAIDPHDLSIQIMQTYSNFTVGGSLSVNAHGRYMGRGPIVGSVHSLRLVLADGSIVDASREENSELFFAAIGGYGGIGVIAEATLDLVPNVKVERHSQTMATSDYAAFFRNEVRDDEQIVFHNADLHPPHFDSARAVSWRESPAELTETARLIPRGEKYRWTPMFINGTTSFPGGFALRKYIVEPLFYSSTPVVWRNHEASYDIAELEPDTRVDKTYVLREYFVPAERFDDFVPLMRDVFARHDAHIINVSVRHANADPNTLLSWARGETFAFVVYYAQETTPEAIEAVGKWSRDMVDAVLSVGGTYYLPYQNHATRAQFDRAYPRAPEFFALKKRIDPELRFQNSLFYHYGPSPRAARDQKLAALGYEKKPEGQTLLTIPEWYLVWNPVEYVAHLEKGRAPDEFPFVASVGEYMNLYKKVLRASDGAYPENGEYLTMLRVIGVSTSVEYLVKSAYERTIGRAFRFTSSGAKTAEDGLILDAHRAYSQLIFDEPWYEFRFLPWVGRIWKETPVWGPDFLRRTERKLAFTAEFSVKALYAKLLGLAAKSAYGPAHEKIHALVRVSPDSPLPAGVMNLHEAEPGVRLVALERWKEFSVAVPALAEAGADFVEIAGNDEIAVSLVESQNQPYSTPLARRLSRSAFVSDPSQHRSLWFVPVVQLSAFLRQANAEHVRIEHIYDY